MKDFRLVLEKALHAEYGIAALCHSSEAADTLKRKLYECRALLREEGDRSFDTLSMSISPHSGDILYIYKRREENGHGRP